MRGRTDQAKGALLQLRQIPEDDDYFVTEYHELIANIDHEQDTTSQWQSFKSLMTHCATDPSTRKRLVLVMIVQTLFIMSGGNSITYYAPTILGNMGFDSQEELLFTAICGMVKVASILLYSIVLTDRFGRRPLLLIGATINFVCLLYLSCFHGLASLDKPSAASWVALVMICVFAVGKFLASLIMLTKFHAHISTRRLRIWLGSSFLPHGIRNLPNAHTWHYCHTGVHVSELAELCDHPGIPQHDTGYARLRSFRAVCSFHICGRALGVSGLPRMQRTPDGDDGLALRCAVVQSRPCFNWQGVKHGGRNRVKRDVTAHHMRHQGRSVLSPLGAKVR